MKDSYQMFADFRHRSVLSLKQLIYGPRGEPYRIQGHILRYLPGTRPVRLQYVHSDNANSRYDALQVQLFSTVLKEGDFVIDIGAHAGQYSILMAAVCGPSGRVITFEPDPHARQRLERNLRLNPRVKRPQIESFAVSDQKGEAVLYSRGGNSQSSLARTAVEGSGQHKSEEIHVPVVSLDSFLKERDLPPPQWVKIDVEGAEIRVLNGARNLLLGDTGIVCELHPYAWPEFGNAFPELKRLVAAAGRRMRYLDGDTEVGEQPKYGVVLIERHP